MPVYPGSRNWPESKVSLIFARLRYGSIPGEYSFFNTPGPITGPGGNDIIESPGSVSISTPQNMIDTSFKSYSSVTVTGDGWFFGLSFPLPIGVGTVKIYTDTNLYGKVIAEAVDTDGNVTVLTQESKQVPEGTYYGQLAGLYVLTLTGFSSTTRYIEIRIRNYSMTASNVAGYPETATFKIFSFDVYYASQELQVMLNAPDSWDTVTQQFINRITINTTDWPTVLGKDTNIIDHDLETYVRLESTPEITGEYKCLEVEYREPLAIDKYYVVASDSDTAYPSSVIIHYDDNSSVKVDTYTLAKSMQGYWVYGFDNPYKDRRIVLVELNAYLSLGGAITIYEFLMYPLREIAAVPATKDNQETMIGILQQTRDELSLPNEEIRIITAPDPTSTYVAQIDAGRCNSVAVSVLASDEAPSSITVLGSNDAVNFYPIKNVGFDLASFTLNEYNTLAFYPYARYIRIEVVPGTNTSYMEIRVAGVRP